MTQEFTGLVLLGVVVLLVSAVWLPFFRVYDTQVFKEEQNEANAEARVIKEGAQA